MQINSYYPPSSYSPLTDRFRRIEQQFSDVDRRLEDNVYYRRSVGYNWPQWFYSASSDLRDATRDFDSQTYGRARNVSRDLDRAVDLLSRNGDRLRDLNWRNSSFGRGWGEVLDGPINSVRNAIDVLYRTDDGRGRPGQGGYPGGPGGYPDGPGGYPGNGLPPRVA